MNKAVKTAFLFSLFLLALSMISCTEKNPGSSGTADSLSKAIKQGALIYENKCLKCHGEDAKGGICPNLTEDAKGGICPNLTDDEWKYGDSDEDFYKSIAEGRPGGMPGWEDSLGKEKIDMVISYIRSLSIK